MKKKRKTNKLNLVGNCLFWILWIPIIVVLFVPMAGFLSFYQGTEGYEMRDFMNHYFNIVRIALTLGGFVFAGASFLINQETQIQTRWLFIASILLILSSVFFLLAMYSFLGLKANFYSNLEIKFAYLITYNWGNTFLSSAIIFFLFGIGLSVNQIGKITLVSKLDKKEESISKPRPN